jgi:hypothetical protein
MLNHAAWVACGSNASGIGRLGGHDGKFPEGVKAGISAEANAFAGLACPNKVTNCGTVGASRDAESRANTGIRMETHAVGVVGI